ncbi:MAG: YaiO family outer membrane beta-barrel protein [Bacteroidia bacterium]|nr:YaiO family outer membrane beta-barrel protein [Bacteroidia bacterium]
MPRSFRRITLILFLFVTSAYSQDTIFFDVDKVFERARRSAFTEKNNQDARDICKKILEKHPDYHDARVLIANTLSWERRFQEARAEIIKVLEKKPEYYDAVTVLLNIEFWSGNLRAALQVANKGIELFPNEYYFKLTKAKILDQLEEYDEALVLLEELKKPKNKPGGANSGQTVLPPEDVMNEIDKMIHDIELKRKRNHAGAMYTLELFSDVYAPRHLLELEGKHRFGKTTAIVRGSAAQRFERTGLMGEADLYYKLNKLTYLYLNGGFSPSAIFPRFRSGFEVYRRLPRNMDASIGLRYLHFVLTGTGTKEIFILTGSVGKYYSHYWFGLRPFITPRGTGAAVSLLAHARRYLRDTENHFTLTAGYGLTPDNRVFLGDNPEFYQVSALRLGADLQKVLADNYFLLAGICFETQRLNNLPGLTIFDGVFQLGIRYRF